MSTLTAILGAGVLWLLLAVVVIAGLCRAATQGDRRTQAEPERLPFRPRVVEDDDEGSPAPVVNINSRRHGAA